MGVRRCLSGLSPDSLAFFAERPPRPEQGCNGTRGIFENGNSPADFAYAFAHERLNRCAFFNPRRKMVRIARKTDGLLAGNQELYQIRMSAMKLNLISSDLLE